MDRKALTEDTVIEIGKAISLSKYRAFFMDTTGKELSGWEFQPWLNTQIGKTLKEAVADYKRAVERKDMVTLMEEERFRIISDIDKAFILAFDREMERLGYSAGGGIGDGYCWGKYMIVYTKAGAKSKKIIARIFIRENGIVLRLFLNNIDKHRTYLANAPEHIKSVFMGSHGNCNCHPQKANCRMRKTYTVDGQLYEKCSGVVFEFPQPTVEKNTDYISLLQEFYPLKKR